jgi:prepilin-type N-terminal cleavage/methylation domain-containing protein
VNRVRGAGRRAAPAPLVRRGFTLIEIVVAMSLTLAVFAITLPFVRAQTRALGSSAGRLDADQIARYAQRAIDRDLRQASAVEGQPLLVLAGPMAIAFNANLLAPDTTDPGAVDIDEGADASLTESFALAAAAPLPLVARSYPELEYVDASGAASRSETIQYFLHPDTITGRSDIYVLYRRVNARDSVQIVRGLHVPADSAFFSYHRPLAGTLTRIDGSRLPLYWDSVAVDSVTAVGIRAAGYFKDRLTGAETIRTVRWTTVIPNAALAADTSCGDAPAAAGSVAVQKNPNPSSNGYRVAISWQASTDDTGMDLDVRYYQVGVRHSSATEYRRIATVQARGLSTYRWDHLMPRDTGTTKYGVRVIDCGGNPSAWVTHPGTPTLTLP